MRHTIILTTAGALLLALSSPAHADTQAEACTFKAWSLVHAYTDAGKDFAKAKAEGKPIGAIEALNAYAAGQRYKNWAEFLAVQQYNCPNVESEARQLLEKAAAK